MGIVNRVFHDPFNVMSFYVLFGFVKAIATGSCAALLDIGCSISTDLSNKFKDTLVKNWKVWSLPMLLNYHFVPIQFRVFFSITLAVVWTVILSIIAHRLM